jgi:hypothetical protein
MFKNSDENIWTQGRGITGLKKKTHNERLQNLYSSPNIIYGQIKGDGRGM